LLPGSEFENSILKPLSSVDFARRYGNKGFLVRSREEALSRMAGVEYPIMLQEFIPGPATAGYFVEGLVDARGRMRARFVRQRLRMYPPHLGNSTLMMSVSPEQMQSVFDDLNLLFATTAYRGIFNAEFKFDEGDGLFKLIEINARPWWYIEFAAECGVDVCSMMYEDALGLPIRDVETYEKNRRCAMVANDFLAWRHEGRGLHSLLTWARPWLGAKSALVHWNDPEPGILYCWRILKKRLGRWSKKSGRKDPLAPPPGRGGGR
jgi:predicted ATP-grasp superfamily ATP-dependent carboligase